MDEDLRDIERRANATRDHADIDALQRAGARVGRNFRLVRETRRALILEGFAGALKRRMNDMLDGALVYELRVPDDLPGGRNREYAPEIVRAAIRRCRDRIERNILLGMVEPQPDHVRNDRIELRRTSHLVQDLTLSRDGRTLTAAVKLLASPEGARLRSLLAGGVSVRPNLVCHGRVRTERRTGVNAFPGAHAGSHRTVEIVEEMDIITLNFVAWFGNPRDAARWLRDQRARADRRNVEGFSPLADEAERVLAENLVDVLPTPPLPPTREGARIIEGAVFSVMGDDGEPHIDVPVPTEFIGRENNQATRDELREWFRRTYGA